VLSLQCSVVYAQSVFILFYSWSFPFAVQYIQALVAAAERSISDES
jgi:hypothetical protein